MTKEDAMHPMFAELFQRPDDTLETDQRRRLHGFESLTEQKLVAWDFLGDLMDVVPQPFRLAFTTASGPSSHFPDFLMITRSGTWLVDVPPADRIGDEDQIKFTSSVGSHPA
jgi:hypothetical protein